MVRMPGVPMVVGIESGVPYAIVPPPDDPPQLGVTSSTIEVQVRCRLEGRSHRVGAGEL